jgi:hypothetical protein
MAGIALELSVISKKLETEFEAIDLITMGNIREAWKGVSPAPSCPPILETMKAVHEICVSGINQRSTTAINVASEYLLKLPGGVSPELTADIKSFIKSKFPENLYVATAQNTLRVYGRANAPSHKATPRLFHHELALIKVSSANLSRRGVSKILNAVDESALQNPSNAATQPIGFKRQVKLFCLAHWQWLIATAVATAGVVVAL